MDDEVVVGIGRVYNGVARFCSWVRKLSLPGAIWIYGILPQSDRLALRVVGVGASSAVLWVSMLALAGADREGYGGKREERTDVWTVDQTTSESP